MGHFMQEKVGYLHESQWIQGKVLKRRKVQDFMLLCETKQTFFFFFLSVLHVVSLQIFTK